MADQPSFFPEATGFEPVEYSLNILGEVMFQSDELIYIQMQKTGCTHIALLLSSLFKGEQIGKHNAASQSQINSHRLFISSIRNPWDWYLSLWTYGTQGEGALMHRLTERRLFRTLKSVIRSPKKNYKSLLHEMSKRPNLWRNVYDNSENIESFRKWLKQIHAPKNSLFLGEGYGNTAITNMCGFMTYRYLYLCCRNVEQLANDKFISNYPDLLQFENDNCYINFFIPQESLEKSLCEAIEKVRPLTQEDKDFIFAAKKTNTSKRALTISDYYDEEAIELIRSRERLLIDKFGYVPPS